MNRHHDVVGENWIFIFEFFHSIIKFAFILFVLASDHSSYSSIQASCVINMPIWMKKRKRKYNALEKHTNLHTQLKDKTFCSPRVWLSVEKRPNFYEIFSPSTMYRSSVFFFIFAAHQKIISLWRGGICIWVGWGGGKERGVFTLSCLLLLSLHWLQMFFQITTFGRWFDG